MQRAWFLLHSVLAVCLLVVSARASAQAAPADPPQASDSPSGAAAEVAAAATVAEAPTGATPSVERAEPTEAASVPAFAGSVRLLETAGLQINLFERKQGEWLSVCTSPCTFPAPEGPRDYAAPAKPPPASKRMRVAAKGLWLAGGDGLQAELHDRQTVRKAGAGVALAGLLTLVLPLIIGVGSDAAAVSIATTGAAVTVGGAVMLLMRDRVKLTRCVGCYPAGRPR